MLSRRGYTIFRPSPVARHSVKGFTLAELLIALLILAEIATFAIPKILAAQQNSRFNAGAKEAASAIAATYQQMQMEGVVNSAMTPTDVLQRLNYVTWDTSSTVDSYYGAGTNTCTAGVPCVRLHNGGMIIRRSNSFGGTNTTNAIMFGFDPDGVSDSTTNGPGKSVIFALYYNGRITSMQLIDPTTYSGGGTASPNPDPPWFSW